MKIEGLHSFCEPNCLSPGFKEITEKRFYFITIIKNYEVVFYCN